MAPTREQLREWQGQVAPAEGLKGRFDRGAWSAAGQREPWLFSWPRAMVFAVLTIAGLAALVALEWAEITALIGGSLAVALLIGRAHQLHRRYLERRGATGGD